MSQQSYRSVFVSNTGTLLASGKTVEGIAVGQVGVLDGNTHLATTTPTYAKNKALELVWGTPDLGDLPLMSGVPNQNEYSKLIKGKLLKNFRGHRAKRAQNEVWTVGWSGDDADTDTLFAKPGEVKYLYVKLTGGVIDKLYSKQGITRMFSTKAGVTDDCGDPCTDVDCRLLVDDLVKQINSDPLIGTNSPSGVSKNRFIKASSIVSCGTPPSLTTDIDYVFDLIVCDNGDDASLGTVQSQYPNDTVKRVSRTGSSSTYEVVRDTNSTPTSFNNQGINIIDNCDVCPTGYTLVDDGLFVYEVQRADAGTSGALTTLKSNYGIAAGDESGIRLNYEFGTSTYIIVSDSSQTASGVDSLTFLGLSRGTCVITNSSFIAWGANGTLTKFGKEFTITVADDVCGVSRLADLQAAYPDLTVSQVSESDNGCVNSFSTTVFSQPVLEGCSEDELVFIKPDAFEGIEWQEVTTLTGSDCKCGIRFDVAFTNRITNECTFDYFPYESDTVHVQLSSFDPDYNKSPDEAQWVVKKIQSFQHAAGFGAYVRDLEKQSKSYFLQERSFDPVVREIQGYQFVTDPNKYYDEYVLEFEFSYKVGGWGQTYTDSYHQSVFFPEANGGAFENAINGYIASAAIQIDPVHLG